jgi:hypothetical protein
VNKTTVYLPERLKLALERVAATTGRSEAEVIRQAIEEAVASSEPAQPRGALFESGDASLSESVDAALAGFGER